MFTAFPGSKQNLAMLQDLCSAVWGTLCYRKAKVCSSNFCSVIGKAVKISRHCKPLQSADGKQQCLESSRAGGYSS